MDTPEVTVTITSCNRLDLLERTLDSFLKYNTYPIKEFIVSEDDCNADLTMLRRKYSGLNIRWIQNTLLERRGLLENNDFVHELVNTPYFFHCEDDWEFYREGFIERSMCLMQKWPFILNVWLRDLSDTNGHPIDEFDHLLEKNGMEINFREVKPKYQGCWHGFTTNPTLKRLKDKVRYSAIAKIGNQNIGPEARVSEYYYHAGFTAVILTEGYVRHIGDGRTTL